MTEIYAYDLEFLKEAKQAFSDDITLMTHIDIHDNYIALRCSKGDITIYKIDRCVAKFKGAVDEHPF